MTSKGRMSAAQSKCVRAGRRPNQQGTGLMNQLAERIRAGDRRALARGLSAVENNAPGADELLASLHTAESRALRIGVTGAPGSGKSTLVDCATRRFRDDGATVAILAVDPSSPFSGGAILGDRVRMQRHHNDPGVFIRSMASRGQLGGLGPAVVDSLTVLEAFGADAVIVETAGVGQSEVDVVQLATTVAVVLVPTLGDDIQAAKAGIMEIADLFVINKADLPGANELERQVLAMISLIPGGKARPPIVRTVATRCEGVDAFVDQVREAGFARMDAPYWKRMLLERIGGEMKSMLGSGRALGADLDRAAEAIAAARLNPYAYLRDVLDRLRQQWKP